MDVEAYRHQVGGHSVFMKPRGSPKVYKPFIEDEHRFYEKLAAIGSSSYEYGPLHILKKFIPKYYGTTEISIKTSYRFIEDRPRPPGSKGSASPKIETFPRNADNARIAENAGSNGHPPDTDNGSKTEISRNNANLPVSSQHASTVQSPLPPSVSAISSRGSLSSVGESPKEEKSRSQDSRRRDSSYISSNHTLTNSSPNLTNNFAEEQSSASKAGAPSLAGEANKNECLKLTSSQGFEEVYPHNKSKENEDDARSSSSHITSSRQTVVHETSTSIRHIVLEDLVYGFKKPCVLDIKIGKRQRKMGATPEKERRQLEKSLKTTSHELGFRLCGCQFYNKKTGQLSYRDKYWGRRLTKESVASSFRKWFWNGISFCDKLIPSLILKLKSLHQCVRDLKHYRFWSSSLLWFYDGSIEDEQCQIESLDIRIIDFANTIYLQDNPSPDEEYLFGLRNLIEILEGLLEAPPPDKGTKRVEVTAKASSSRGVSTHSERLSLFSRSGLVTGERGDVIDKDHVNKGQLIPPPKNTLSPSETLAVQLFIARTTRSHYKGIRSRPRVYAKGNKLCVYNEFRNRKYRAHQNYPKYDPSKKRQFTVRYTFHTLCRNCLRNGRFPPSIFQYSRKGRPKGSNFQIGRLRRGRFRDGITFVKNKAVPSSNKSECYRGAMAGPHGDKRKIYRGSNSNRAKGAEEHIEEHAFRNESFPREIFAGGFCLKGLPEQKRIAPDASGEALIENDCKEGNTMRAGSMQSDSMQNRLFQKQSAQKEPLQNHFMESGDLQKGPALKVRPGDNIMHAELRELKIIDEASTKTDIFVKGSIRAQPLLDRVRDSEFSKVTHLERNAPSICERGTNEGVRLSGQASAPTGAVYGGNSLTFPGKNMSDFFPSNQKGSSQCAPSMKTDMLKNSIGSDIRHNEGSKRGYNMKHGVDQDADSTIGRSLDTSPNCASLGNLATYTIVNNIPPKRKIFPSSRDAQSPFSDENPAIQPKLLAYPKSVALPRLSPLPPKKFEKFSERGRDVWVRFHPSPKDYTRIKRFYVRLGEGTHGKSSGNLNWKPRKTNDDSRNNENTVNDYRADIKKLMKGLTYLCGPQFTRARCSLNRSSMYHCGKYPCYKALFRRLKKTPSKQHPLSTNDLTTSGIVPPSLCEKDRACFTPQERRWFPQERNALEAKCKHEKSVQFAVVNPPTSDPVSPANLETTTPSPDLSSPVLFTRRSLSLPCFLRGNESAPSEVRVERTEREGELNENEGSTPGETEDIYKTEGSILEGGRNIFKSQGGVSTKQEDILGERQEVSKRNGDIADREENNFGKKNEHFKILEKYAEASFRNVLNERSTPESMDNWVRGICESVSNLNIDKDFEKIAAFKNEDKKKRRNEYLNVPKTQQLLCGLSASPRRLASHSHERHARSRLAKELHERRMHVRGHRRDSYMEGYRADLHMRGADRKDPRIMGVLGMDRRMESVNGKQIYTIEKDSIGNDMRERYMMNSRQGESNEAQGGSDGRILEKSEQNMDLFNLRQRASVGHSFSSGHTEIQGENDRVLNLRQYGINRSQNMDSMLNRRQNDSMLDPRRNDTFKPTENSSQRLERPHSEPPHGKTQHASRTPIPNIERNKLPLEGGGSRTRHWKQHTTLDTQCIYSGRGFMNSRTSFSSPEESSETDASDSTDTDDTDDHYHTPFSNH